MATRRRLRAGAAGAVALLGLGAAAAHAAAVSRPDVPRQPAITRDAHECGPGFSLIGSATDPWAGCVHTTPDRLASASAPASRTLARGPASAKVPCYGDGTTGPRVQVVYGYVEGERNLAASFSKQLRTQIAPRMQAVINAQSLGQDLGIRFAMTKGCKAIDIRVIKIDREIARTPSGRSTPAGDQLGGIARQLSAMGLNQPLRKYQVYLDGGSSNACGIAYTPRGGIGSSNPHATGAEGAPVGIEGIAKRRIVGTASVNLVFGGECRVDTYGISTVTTELHELFHNLGAVQDDAPHADTGHCFDAPSVMCSGGVEGYGLGVQIPACEKVLVETLDCGMDDYWNPNPRPGSYLATHLNIAKSQFFGPQPGDTIEPLRP